MLYHLCPKDDHYRLSINQGQTIHEGQIVTEEELINLFVKDPTLSSKITPTKEALLQLSLYFYENGDIPFYYSDHFDPELEALKDTCRLIDAEGKTRIYIVPMAEKDNYLTND